VRHPLRHVIALRVSKAVLIYAIALFYTILVLNYITDYGSNYEFVRYVLMMDSTFPPSRWRSREGDLRRTTVPDWSLNVFNGEDAGAQLSILRAIASSDLHNLVYAADYRIVPVVNRTASS
jgi:Predicted small integral membrane protein (DUF2165)